MGVGPKKLEALRLRMLDCGIKKEDIEEKFIRGSGRGGQKLNKTSSAVFIRHIPTGISVKCGSERSQHLNRFLALRRLVDCIENTDPELELEKAKKIQQIRKQKKKRKKRSRIKRSRIKRLKS